MDTDPIGESTPTVEEDGGLGAVADEDRISPRLDAVLVAQSVPPQLLAAELYFMEPTASGLRELFSQTGGFEGLELATAEGAFDLVRFDPQDPDRLLASNRSSYGEALNNDSNEIWTLTGDGMVEQQLWAPARAHDFAHFNVDGSATMWVHGGGSGFAPRQAVFLDNALTETGASAPVYASRFTSVSGAVFALTGNGDYYSHDREPAALIADQGDGPVTLHEGVEFGWIDNPTPEILVAYPDSADGLTAVWDTTTLAELLNHPLAGRRLARAAISGDETVAVAATADGRLEAIDMMTGLSMGSFGEVDVTGVDQPIALNENGTVAVTVEHSGQVTIWWVGEDRPVASIGADAAQPRWVSEEYSPKASSVIALDGSRLALRVGAVGSERTHYVFLDTSIESWIARACDQAERRLTEQEATSLGLPACQRACSDRSG
ncbi:MAG: hypothetical protein ACR2QO_17555 [Acidimicrobiales bacterium]